MAKTKQNGPEFIRYFWPVIEVLKQSGGSGRPKEVCDLISQILKISEQQRTEPMPGGSSRFENQVAWARFYLSKADYIDASKRGVWILTDKGRAASHFDEADSLEIFKQVQTLFRNDDTSDLATNSAVDDSEAVAPSPTTTAEEGNYRVLLLRKMLSLPPNGFERLCQRLLREAGFEQVVVTGKSGDGGIDGNGVLKINPFVSFRVLFQCKRYKGSVSAPQVRDFRGALMGRADKGIILTTGSFTADAQAEALRDGATAIELVNGEKLMEMCENLELGLKQRRTYDIDFHFFTEFES